MADKQVEFQDVEGRKCLFKMNTAGQLDYFVNGRQKVLQLREVKIEGTTVHFDGRRLMTTESELQVPDEDAGAVLPQLLALAEQAVVPKEVLRCFVKVWKGVGLRAADVGGKSDPYTIVGIPGKADSRDQTHFINRTLDPVWNQNIEVHHYEAGDALEFTVMDHDYFSKDDFLGFAKISAEDLQARTWEGELKLGDSGKHGATGKMAKGKIFVKVTITSEAADPATAAAYPPTKVVATATPGSIPVFSTDQQLRQVREDLMASTFKALDRGGKAAIGSAEVRRLAEVLGFHCEDGEWDVEFGEVLQEVGEGAPAISEVQFNRLLNDPQDLAYAYCDNGILGKVLDELCAQNSAAGAGESRAPRVVATSWTPHDKTQELMDQKSRHDLTAELFALLDGNNSGRLNHPEMKLYAKLCGFDGTDDEWTVEYTQLCVDHGWSAKEGADHAAFAELVSNETDGAYSTTPELRMCIAALKQEDTEGMIKSVAKARTNMWLLRPQTMEVRSQRPRGVLVKALFETLDDQGEGRLGPDELKRFAEMCGFDGTDEDWAVEYAELCMEYGINPKGGATVEQFEQVINKKAGQADINGAQLVELIEQTRTEGAENVKGAKERRGFATQKTWRPVSKNFAILRNFALSMKDKAPDPDAAFALFTNKPFGRLTKDEFVTAANKLEIDDPATVFRLLTLGSNFVVKKHLKWCWNLLDAEELVLQRRGAATRKFTMSPDGELVLPAPQAAPSLAVPTSKSAAPQLAAATGKSVTSTRSVAFAGPTASQQGEPALAAGTSKSGASPRAAADLAVGTAAQEAPALAAGTSRSVAATASAGGLAAGTAQGHPAAPALAAGTTKSVGSVHTASGVAAGTAAVAQEHGLAASTTKSVASTHPVAPAATATQEHGLASPTTKSVASTHPVAPAGTATQEHGLAAPTTKSVASTHPVAPAGTATQAEPPALAASTTKSLGAAAAPAPPLAAGTAGAAQEAPALAAATSHSVAATRSTSGPAVEATGSVQGGPPVAPAPTVHSEASVHPAGLAAGTAASAEAAHHPEHAHAAEAPHHPEPAHAAEAAPAEAHAPAHAAAPEPAPAPAPAPAAEHAPAPEA